MRSAPYSSSALLAKLREWSSTQEQESRSLGLPKFSSDTDRMHVGVLRLQVYVFARLVHRLWKIMVLGEIFYYWGQGEGKVKKITLISKEETRELQASQDNLIPVMVMEEVLMEFTLKHRKDKKVTKTACVALPSTNCNWPTWPMRQLSSIWKEPTSNWRGTLQQLQW